MKRAFFQRKYQLHLDQLVHGKQLRLLDCQPFWTWFVICFGGRRGKVNNAEDGPKMITRNKDNYGKGYYLLWFVVTSYEVALVRNPFFMDLKRLDQVHHF